jgi:predicted Holliday junction resolvase-like endonuclease
MYDLYYLVVIGVLLCGVAWLGWLLVRQKETNKDSKDKYSKVLHDKISSEVRVGRIGENMAPFLNDWPYDPNDFRFLGNPIDGVQFTDEEIIFVEIKTGRSRLSRTQKRLRDLIKEKKVSFATFRIGENGCKLKKEEDGED